MIGELKKSDIGKDISGVALKCRRIDSGPARGSNSSKSGRLRGQRIYSTERGWGLLIPWRSMRRAARPVIPRSAVLALGSALVAEVPSPWR